MKIPEKPLREIMLDVHETRLKDIYDLPESCTLAYNDKSTQICVDNTPIYAFLHNELNDSTFVDRLLNIRKKTRKKIINAHQNPSDYSSEDLFNLQFDYELLGLDHLVDPERIQIESECIKDRYKQDLAKRVLLTPISGRTFFEEVNIKELESLGNMQRNGCPMSEEYFFFQDKGFEYFTKHTLTRNKLIRIILDNSKIIDSLKKRYEALPTVYSFESIKDIYSVIKDMRLEQMKRRCVIASVLNSVDKKKRKYLEFATYALEYNEDNRLLRSVSFFHIMKDKTIPERFYKLIEGRRK